MKECQCCSGVELLTPAAITNPQGLSSIVYRIGEHGSFFESMLGQLAGDRDFGLRTRETDDFSIAILDAAAVLCDILSFYQERFANEHYLRTAVERQSLAGLGQLSGYRLAPGRAASTYLAFTLESAIVPPPPAVPGLPPGPYPNPGAVEGVPSSIVIPAGTKVQSVPGPGQTAQIFESIDDITARPEWNSIPLRVRASYPSSAAGFNQIELAGFVHALKEGDRVLLRLGSGTPVFNQVTKVDAQAVQNRTSVTFASGAAPSAQLPSLEAPPAAPPPADLDDSYIASSIRRKGWKQSDLESIADGLRWEKDRLERAIRGSQANDAPGLSMFVLGASAALFGHNAQSYDSTGRIEILSHQPPKTLGEAVIRYEPVGTPDSTISVQGADANSFFLDNTSQAAVPGRWVVLEAPGIGPLAAVIASVRDLTISLFDLRSRVTQVTLANLTWLANTSTLGNFSLRRTGVLIETVRASAAAPRIENATGYADAGGSSLLLDGPYFGLAAGHEIVVTGELISLPGQAAFEQATLASADLNDGYTLLTLAQPLVNRYKRDTARVLANIAEATHGESVDETLGGGDATVAFQRFALKQTPVTYVSAAVPGGILPSIVVRVNGVEWKLVDNLFAAGPQDHVYMLQTSSDGKTWVVFGDGVNGARLPGGAENITAHYRRGIGKSGNLDAGQLSLALSRPLGLSGVVNPVAATGGGDPETLEEARISLPFPLRTLGRIVTLQDYEDFARASAGIAKASAHWIWDGHRWVAMVTIAGPDGETIPAGTPAYDDLLFAMQQAGDPHVPSAIADYRPRFFDLDASLTVDPDYVSDTVLAAAHNALRSAFTFAKRAFVQPVFLSEVILELQNTEGVIAVDLNALFFSGTTPDLTSPPPEVLTVTGPSLSGSTLSGAGLLTIGDGPLRGLRVKS
jgi:predicted phage baseplate assembly protein